LMVTNAIGSQTLPDYNTLLHIGDNTMYGHLLNGQTDEFRISKGIARWTSNFTPPTAEYDSSMLSSYNKRYRIINT
ncbi:MAG TPA: hypothetical protein ENI61_04750, partial [Ignavibacteria bacterium]|nr:hypothetical protein [Ignavibacteria bacterium]